MGALITYPAVAAEGWDAFLERSLGAGALVSLALGLGVRAGGLVAIAVALAGAEYAVFVATTGNGEIDGSAVFYAGGLVALAELAYWSLEREAAAPATELVVRRLAAVLVSTGAAAVLAVLVLASSEVRIGAGLALEAVGVLAATVMIGFLAWLATRPKAEA